MKKGILIALPGDEHCGSTTGLMPPGEWKFETGGSYYPSPAQQWLYEQWETAWHKIRKLRKGRKLIVVNMGDAIDGAHHKTLELVTQNTDEQALIHIECMDRAMKIAGKFDSLYYIRGTESHVTTKEEFIADDLGAVQKRPGSHVWDQLFLEGNSTLIDLCHHGAGVGRRAWTKGNSFRSMMVSYYYYLLDAGHRIPRYVVRAHQHQHTHRTIKDRKYNMDGLITPSFQLKTHYGHRVANMALSDIGMSYIIIDKDRSWAETWLADVPERKPEVINV
ncbi:MAG: hypothetical protein U9N61_10060 [Euryarchaeota archaeon]|nr:hypothetical protein [Euryarchaeota archaeon]